MEQLPEYDQAVIACEQARTVPDKARALDDRNKNFEILYERYKRACAAEQRERERRGD